MNLSARNLSFLFLIASLCSLPFSGIKVIFFGLPLYLPEIAILFSLGTVLFPVAQAVKRSFPDRWFLLGYALFLLGGILSFFLNPFSWMGLGMIKSWFFFPILLGLLVWWHSQEESRRHLLLVSWWGVMSAVAIANLVLFLQGAVTYDGRLAGFYTSPNFLAVFVAPAVLLSGYFLLVSQRPMVLWQKSMVVLGGIASLITVFFTRSYETWLALSCALIFLLGGLSFQKRISMRVLLQSGALLVLVLIGGMSIEQETEKWRALIEGSERSSFHSRIMIWEAAVRIAHDHPLFGIGVGRFQTEYLFYQRYFPPYLEWAVPEPHNLFLAVFLSTGVLGLGGFLLMLFRFFIPLLSQVPKKKEAVLFLSLMLFLLLYGLTDTPYFKTDLSLLFFLVLFLGLTLLSKEKSSSFEERKI